MSTEIEAQIHNYFEWVEHRTGHNLRPSSADAPGSVRSSSSLPSVQVESLSDLHEVEAPRNGQGQRRHRNTILLTAAATLAVVVGLVAIGSGRTESPTTPLAQPTLPQPSQAAPLPGWEGNVAMKIYVRPEASGEQRAAVEAVLNESTDVIAEWSYLDADASLQEAERVLVDEPGTFELLDVNNVPTVFNLVATPAATDDSLDQLAERLNDLTGVLDTVTAKQAERQSSQTLDAMETSEAITETTAPLIDFADATVPCAGGSETNSFDYAEGKPGAATIDEAVDGWTFEGGAPYLRAELVSVVDAETGRAALVDGDGNLRILLTVRENENGWLVESSLRCLDP